MECVPFGAAGPSFEQQNTQASSCQPQPQANTQGRRMRHSSSSRGVEVSDSSPHLKYEVSDSCQETLNPHQFIKDSSTYTNFDMMCDSDKNDNSLAKQFNDEQSQVDMEGKRPSCSYSVTVADFPSSSSSVNGWASYSLAFPLSQLTDGSKVHHRPGTKERMFVCSYCGKAFNRPKKVEIHQRIHTGEKPFSCSTCGKTFSEAGNLRKHQRVHTREKPYSCGACGKGFAWIRNLKAHQQKSHPDIYTERD